MPSRIPVVDDEPLRGLELPNGEADGLEEIVGTDGKRTGATASDSRGGKQARTGRPHQMSAHSSKGGGKGRGGRRGGRGQAGGSSALPADYWIDDRHIRFSIALLSRQVSKLSQKDRKNTAVTFDWFEGKRTLLPLKAVLDEYEKYLKYVRAETTSEEQRRALGPPGPHCGLTYIETLAAGDVGNSTREILNGFLEEMAKLDIKMVGLHLPSVSFENPGDHETVRIGLPIKHLSVPLRAAIIKASEEFKILFHRGVPQPGFMEDQISQMASLLA